MKGSHSLRTQVKENDFSRNKGPGGGEGGRGMGWQGQLDLGSFVAKGLSPPKGTMVLCPALRLGIENGRGEGRV